VTGPSLTPDERALWDQLITAAVNGDMSATDVTKKSDKVLELLEDDERKGYQWADRILEEAARAGLRTFVYRWLRAHDVAAYKDHAGNVSSISTRVGVERDGGHQQVLFTELTRPELVEHVEMLQRQRQGLNDRIAAERLLIKLIDAHPGCLTVGEALDASGLTLDDVLGEAA
jgi:hypothetical protein